MKIRYGPTIMPISRFLKMAYLEVYEGRDLCLYFRVYHSSIPEPKAISGTE